MNRSTYGIRRSLVVVLLGLLAIAALVTPVNASHSWGDYHWARTSTQFTIKLGDNVSSKWDSYLTETDTDWTSSTVLDTTIVSGGTRPSVCNPTAGRVEVCNARYGQNGWLGLASIWANGSHITQGTAKLNDNYFDTARYNTPAWRRNVMCQEVGHTFGLGHQDENFDNANIGSCMDYTNDPDGGEGGASPSDPSNEHPNTHDYDLLAKIYEHTDNTTTVGSLPAGFANAQLNSEAEWGTRVKGSREQGVSMYVRDFGNGYRIFTVVIWAK